jgi:tRNA G18 (ribose-2'-O)-methylase SpoU
MLQEITDPGDPRLVDYRDLKDSALRRRSEEAARVFVLEGALAIEAALASPYPLVSVLVLHRRLAVQESLALPPGTPVYVVRDEVMNAVAGFDVHRGLLAQGPASPLVVVEGVNDQENLGAIFRNAAAFGAGAILLDPRCADPLFRRCVRVSLGQVLKVPYARLDGELATGGLDLLSEHGFVPLALTPKLPAERLETVAAELRGLKVALVVGAEATAVALHRLAPHLP